MPVAVYVDASGVASLSTDGGGEQYFRSTTAGAPVWSGPIYSIQWTPGQSVDDSKSLASDPSTGYVYEAYVFRIGWGPYTVMFTRSLDGGATWSSPVALSSGFSNGSNLALGPNGEIYLVWMDYQQNLVLGRKSTDHGASFAPPFTVGPVFDNPQAVPLGWQVPFEQSSRYDPPYAPTLVGPAPNFPTVAVDRSAGPYRGRVYVTWMDRADGTTGAAAGGFAGGPAADQATLVPLNADLAGSFPPDVDGYGQPEVNWFAFDGVAGQTVSLGGTSFVSSPDGSGVMSFELYAQAGDGSLHHWLHFLLQGGGVVVPPPIVTLPRTGRYYLVTGNGGYQYSSSYVVNLREYVPSGGSVARDMRDVVLAGSADGGATWGAVERVNHDPPGADQSMPAVAVDGQGLVYVAWYDARGYALGDSVNAFASVSGDGGQTFSPDLRLSSQPTSWLPPAYSFSPYTVGQFVGDRIALAAGPDYAFVGWTDFRAGADAAHVYGSPIHGAVVATGAISDLSAEVASGGVQVHWLVNSTRGVLGVRLFRTSLADGLEVPLTAEAPPQGEGEASYLDASAEPGQSYSYRLAVHDGVGTHWLGPAPVTLPPRITALAWRLAQPNPFASETDVALAVPVAGAALVRVYDVQGQEVRTLLAGPVGAGEQRLHWDGRDAGGQRVAAGVYFLTAQVNGARARMKLARVP